MEMKGKVRVRPFWSQLGQFHYPIVNAIIYLIMKIMLFHEFTAYICDIGLPSFP